MGLKAAGADLAFSSGLFNGNRFLAAFSAQGTEQSWAAYARIMMALADWEASGSDYVNRAVENFPTLTGAGVAITHWGLYSAMTGGNLLLDRELGTPSDAPPIGATVGFDAQAIGWGFDGHVTQAGSVACLTTGLISGTKYLSLHTGDPGNNGDNALSGESPIAVTNSQWTLSTSGSNRRVQNNAVLSFGAAGSNLDRPTWVALRSGNADDASVLWADEMSPQPDDPDQYDVLRFNVNALSILLPIDI